jgi:hypothetical protein
MMLNPFIWPPLIAYRPEENPCVMSCGWMYGAGFSRTFGPGWHPFCPHSSVPPFVAPFAPGYVAK